MRRATLGLTLLLTASLVTGSFAQSSKKTRKSNNTQKAQLVTPCSELLLSLDQFLAESKSEWLIASADKETTYFYNTRKMVCDDKGTLKVWIKAVKWDWKEIGNYSMNRYELKCSASQIRLISKTEYDKSGNVLDDFTSDNPKWQDVVPDSVGEGILEAVCHKKV